MSLLSLDSPLDGVARFQTLPPRTIARTKHGTHSAPVGAVRIRTVVKQRLRARKFERLLGIEFSNKLAAETCFVALPETCRHRTGPDACSPDGARVIVI